MKIKKYSDFVNEGKMDDYNGTYKSIDDQYDSDRKWFVVNIEEGEIVSAWDVLADAVNDGIVDELLLAQGVIDDDQAWELKDEIDSFLGSFGYFEDDDDIEEFDSYELDEFLEEQGIVDFKVRHRSEL